MDLTSAIIGTLVVALVAIWAIRASLRRRSKYLTSEGAGLRRTVPMTRPMTSSSNYSKGESPSSANDPVRPLESWSSRVPGRVLLSFSAEGYTDIGARSVNDDSYYVQGNFIGIADGVSGVRSSAAATATLALSSVREAVDNAGLNLSAALLNGVYQAQRTVVAKADQDRRFRRIATTVDCVLLDCDDLANPKVHGVHVGDSRAWLVRPGQNPELMTVDHAHPSGDLAQGVGMLESELRPESWTRPVALGDRVVLLTDGVWKPLGPDVVDKILEGCWRLSLSEVSRTLVKIAVGVGGADNATAVVAEVTENVPSSSGVLS